MRFLAALFLFCGFCSAQSSTPVTVNGDWYVIRNRVFFSGTNSLTLGHSSPDTVSSWVNVTNNSTKPGSNFTLSYYGKATDSSTSQVQFLVESEYCVNPATLLGCDSLPTLSGEHYIYGSKKIIDTLSMQNEHAAFKSNTTTEFYIPHATNIRLRAHVVSILSGKSVTYSGIWQLGQ